VNKAARGVLPAGKLPVRLLARLLKRYAAAARADGSVVVGPSVGLDCAVIDFGGNLLLAKTDPVTLVAEDIGLYAIHVNANDIAVMGGVPRWFLATILLPEGRTTARLAERIFSQLSRACDEVGITLCGGHTEVTPGLERPIVVGQMLGEVPERRLVSSAGARPGDDIVLTKGVPIEAGSVIAREMSSELRGVFPEGFIRRCKRLVKDPGLSVVRDARVAMDSARVHAMHDPTEGGLSMGLYELAEASETGLVVYEESIPFVPESLRLLEHYGLDPMGAIASGALLLTVDPRDTAGLLGAFEREGIRASCIGKVTDRKGGIRIVSGGRQKALRVFQRDELTRIL